MRILSFFGLLASIILFGLTLCINFQYCYNWSCNCDFELENKTFYLSASLAFSIFFLIYCVVFLFKFSELNAIQNEEKSDMALDANLVRGNYSVYQLPSVRLFTHIGFVAAMGLFALAYLMLNLDCISTSQTCNEGNCTNDFSYDQELYLLGYGSTAIYYTILTVVALLKSYPSKY